MPFKFDFIDGDVLEWTRAGDGASYRRVSGSTPTVFIGVRDDNRQTLEELREELRRDPKTTRVEFERWFKDLRADERAPVLRVDLERVDEITTFAWEIRQREVGTAAPGTFQLYNVDFSTAFRYCLERGIDPTPQAQLGLLELAIDEKPLADRDLGGLRLDGKHIADRPDVVLERVADELDRCDPDILLVNTAQVLPLLQEQAEQQGADWFQLGRLPGLEQLAGESVFESYGIVGHSPARYNIPGRAIIDRSNSFLWAKSGLQGLLDLTERSWKPIQESGWASIGNLLTAIQIREALRNREVLIPWNKFEPEFYKSSV